MAKTDGIVTTEDLIRANQEISKIPPNVSAASMKQLEPTLVDYIESGGKVLEDRIKTTTDPAKAARDANYFFRQMCFTILRSRDLAYARLWEDAFATYGPLANTMASEDEDEEDDEDESDDGPNE